VGAVIEVEALRKSYGGVERLHGVDFTVEEGEIFAFLGTNGAGKTTTIEILEGYRQRSDGKVSVLGIDPEKAGRAWRNRIGLVLQESELDRVYTVHETVSMFARYFDAPTSIERVIAAVGLGEAAHTRIGRLSGGQKRRVDVALGLVGDPDVLFLDEPTTGLDPSARRAMWTMIDGLRQAGKTIFLTTHYMDEAQHLADRIVILRAGSVAAEGTPSELSRSLGNQTKVTFARPHGVSPEQLAAVTGRAVETDGELVRFFTEDSQRDMTDLLTWARDNDVVLADLQLTLPSLDEVFVRLAEPDPPRPTGEERLPAIEGSLR
jgi:ABC-2 type transport system ATP-binding protein